MWPYTVLLTPLGALEQTYALVNRFPSTWASSFGTLTCVFWPLHSWLHFQILAVSMVDSSTIAAIAALAVAAVPLIVAVGQMTQQLLATAYVIRECDRIVMGGLTKGGTRQWHWRQFRYTVKYQAISFAFPRQLYASLGVSPAVQVEKSDLRSYWIMPFKQGRSEHSHRPAGFLSYKSWQSVPVLARRMYLSEKKAETVSRKT